MAYVARALAEEGLRVVHLVFDDGEPIPARVEGVQVTPLPRDALLGTKLVRRRAIVRGLRDTDAGVYIQRTAAMVTGLIGSFARLKRRRFIFSSASDADFGDGNLDLMRTRLEYRLGLRLASRVVVQTESQRERARRALGLDATVIPSFCELARAEPRRSELFLWIGRIIGRKNPLSFAALAERIPEARFVLVSQSSSSPELQSAVRAAAERLPNLEIRGPIPHRELLALYGHAVAVVNTSDFEGFPNTFLEAWARGTPALSLRVDPDRVIERHGLGVVAGGSDEKLVEAARSLWRQRHDQGVFETAARAYIETTHDPKAVSAAWTELVRTLL